MVQLRNTKTYATLVFYALTFLASENNVFTGHVHLVVYQLHIVYNSSSITLNIVQVVTTTAMVVMP